MTLELSGIEVEDVVDVPCGCRFGMSTTKPPVFVLSDCGRGMACPTVRYVTERGAARGKPMQFRTKRRPKGGDA